MATRSSALRQSAAQRSAPSAKPKQARPKPALGVVDAKQALERARRRQGRVLLVFSGVVLSGALTVAAAGHAMLASTQIRADTLQSELANATATQQNLQLQKATLETPARILQLAKDRFKMVSPSGSTYLSPVNPGESVSEAHESHTAPAKSSARDTSRAR